jgi:signal transduction histidine kinase
VTRTMQSLSLSARMILASAVVALLVGGGFAVLIHALSTLDDVRDQEARSKEIQASALALQKVVVDLETGLRNFTLSGDDRFLAPYRNARRELRPRQRTFERLAAHHPEQRRRAAEITAEIRKYVSDYSVNLISIARDNPAASRTDDAREEGKRYTDSIRSGFLSFLTAENAIASARAQSAEQRSRRAIRLAALGLVACVLLVILFGVYLARSTARPIRGVATAATRLAGGDLSVRLPEKGPGEVGALTAAFNRMAENLEHGRRELESQNEKLRESERRKSELVRIVSHELRTPLASILGFTALLLKRDIGPEDTRRYLEIIDSEGRRLSGLLNDFLDAERLDEGHLHLTPELIDMASVVSDQVRLFEGQSQKHKLDLEVSETPLPVHGDPNRLAQVIGNLLSNAIKYSPEGGTVEVVAKRDNGHVKVSVRDEGLGIPEDLQERVFAKFFRGDASASGIPGSGLGLTIARSVVEAHGGQMSFESARGEGSVFSVELPIAADDGMPAAGRKE